MIDDVRTLEELDKLRRENIIDKAIAEKAPDFVPLKLKKERCKKCGAEVNMLFDGLCEKCSKARRKKK